jgi:hypothetical protein
MTGAREVVTVAKHATVTTVRIKAGTVARDGL